MSALANDQVDLLADAAARPGCPRGRALYPDDITTDEPRRRAHRRADPRGGAGRSARRAAALDRGDGRGDAPARGPARPDRDLRDHPRRARQPEGHRDRREGRPAQGRSAPPPGLRSSACSARRCTSTCTSRSSSSGSATRRSWTGWVCRMFDTYRAAFRAPGSAAFSSAAFVMRLPIAMYPLGLILLISTRTHHYGFAGVLSGVFILGGAAGNPLGGAAGRPVRPAAGHRCRSPRSTSPPRPSWSCWRARTRRTGRCSRRRSSSASATCRSARWCGPGGPTSWTGARPKRAGRGLLVRVDRSTRSSTSSGRCARVGDRDPGRSACWC